MKLIKINNNALAVKNGQTCFVVIRNAMKQYICLELKKVFDADFKESEHPRDKNGQFSEKENKIIKINEKEKSKIDSENNEIEKSEEKLKDFYEWFKNSYAVNEKGEPLVLYHGTDKNFDKFDNEKQKGGTLGKGFYFSSSYELAKNVKKNAIVKSVYLSLQNPIIIPKNKIWLTVVLEKIPEFKNAKTREEMQKIIKDAGYDGFIWNHSNNTEYVVFDNSQIKIKG